MSWLREEVKGAIDDVVEEMTEMFLSLMNDIHQAILSPIVGVPTPRSNTGYMVVGTPDNDPWTDIYQGVYLEFIMPLTIVILIVTLAFIGLQAGSISEYRRKRLLRRLGLVFMGAFVWFPLVSIPLQFIDAIGMTIAPIDEMSTDFEGLIKGALGGVFAVLAMVVVANTALIAAGFVVALREIGILVLTPLMPLLGVLWALEVWPFTPASNIARRAAGIYPGPVVAGIPAAVLFRIGWAIDFDANFQGIYSLFLGLALIPAAILAMLITVYWSSPTMRMVARSGAYATNPAAATSRARNATRTTRRASGRGLRGARNVHRGYASNAYGAVTNSGQTTLGSGGSRGYKFGESARSATQHAGQYNRLRKSDTGRMRDQAAADMGAVKERASTRAKQGSENTKRKVSRW